MNFYKRHLGDIMKACAHLSQGQMGAYDLLMDWCYANERPLPAVKADLYRIGRANAKAERENVDRVIAEFFVLTDAGYTQKRILEEIEKANVQAETNRRIAQEREDRKRARDKQRTEHESCDEPRTNRQPSQTPDTRHQIPTDSFRAGSRATHASAREGPPIDYDGAFEGHDDPPPAAPNPVAPFAIALRNAGHACTSMTPSLIAYQAQGGTVDHLLEVATHPDCAGKNGAYVASFALRELTQPATTNHGNASHAKPGPVTAVFDHLRRTHGDGPFDLSGFSDDDPEALAS